jgi:hypothetical protein
LEVHLTWCGCLLGRPALARPLRLLHLHPLGLVAEIILVVDGYAILLQLLLLLYVLMLELIHVIQVVVELGWLYFLFLVLELIVVALN